MRRPGLPLLSLLVALGGCAHDDGTDVAPPGVIRGGFPVLASVTLSGTVAADAGTVEVWVEGARADLVGNTWTRTLAVPADGEIDVVLHLDGIAVAARSVIVEQPSP